MEILNKLTKEIALKEVASIKNIALERYDNEKAHIEEDKLYIWFVKCITQGMYTLEEAEDIANIIKEILKIDYERWYL